MRQQLAELRRLLDEQQLEKADMEDQMRRLQENIFLPFFGLFKCELLVAGGDEVQDGVVRAADGGGAQHNFSLFLFHPF